MQLCANSLFGLQHWDITLQWRHNGHDSVSNHQPHYCLLNRLFRRRSKKTSKLCVTGLCAGNSQGTGEFPAQMASNAENFSIWWQHHDAKCWCHDIFTLKYSFIGEPDKESTRPRLWLTVANNEWGIKRFKSQENLIWNRFIPHSSLGIDLTHQDVMDSYNLHYDGKTEYLH